MKQKLISVSLALALGLSRVGLRQQTAPARGRNPRRGTVPFSGPVELQFWYPSPIRTT